MEDNASVNYAVNINGIHVDAVFCDRTIQEIFIPLLEILSDMHSKKQKRILVMVAAPPGAGKSTLVSFLEFLSGEIIPNKKVQAVGMDGFHRRQDFLLSHLTVVNGHTVPMVKIKGAPVTFDLELLSDKIREVTEGGVCKWPRYDRLLHNPVDDAVTIDADIVLLEGNYLLLDMEGWKELRAFADYTISVSADEELLRDRLVTRRMATGVTKEKSEEFVDFSDMVNVKLCLEKTMKADLELVLSNDGSEIRKKAEQ